MLLVSGSHSFSGVALTLVSETCKPRIHLLWALLLLRGPVESVLRADGLLLQELEVPLNAVEEILVSHFALNHLIICLQCANQWHSATATNSKVILVSLPASPVCQFLPSQCITFHWCPNTCHFARPFAVVPLKHPRDYPCYTNHQ